jgi:hypothetical protein
MPPEMPCFKHMLRLFAKQALRHITTKAMNFSVADKDIPELKACS